MESRQALYIVFNVDATLRSPLGRDHKTEPIKLGGLADVRAHLSRAPFGSCSYDIYSVQEATAPNGEVLRGSRKTPILTNQPLPIDMQHSLDSKYLSKPKIPSFYKAEGKRIRLTEDWENF